jgi:hypothetical protein
LGRPFAIEDRVYHRADRFGLLGIPLRHGVELIAENGGMMQLDRSRDEGGAAGADEERLRGRARHKRHQPRLAGTRLGRGYGEYWHDVAKVEGVSVHDSQCDRIAGGLRQTSVLRQRVRDLCEQSSAVDERIPGFERLERNRPSRQVIVCGIRRRLALGLLNARPNALCKFIVERPELDPKDIGSRLSRPVQWDGIEMRRFVPDRVIDHFSQPTMVEGRAREQKGNGLGIVTPKVVKILEWWRVFCRNIARSRSDQGLETLPQTANDAAPQRLIGRRTE